MAPVFTMGSPVTALRLVFAGTPEFAAEHLKYLMETDLVCAVITQPDRPGKRGRQPVAGPVKRLAESHRLTLLQPPRLMPEHLTSLPFDIDLLVVVAYGQILKPEILDVPRYGCINVHASLLPRWRGAAPIQRAIQAGDEYSGITIMQMDEGLDTGDILASAKVAIDTLETAASLTQKLIPLGRAQLLHTIDKITHGGLAPVPQPAGRATYARKVEKAEARINFRASALQIARNIRAFNPDPVAWAYLDNLRIRFWMGECIDRHHQETPGEILELSRQGLVIACGEGCLLVTALQLPIGKGKVLTPREMLGARSDLFAINRRFQCDG